jgi:hypothetical protein
MHAFTGVRIRRNGSCVSSTTIPHAAVMNVIPVAAFIRKGEAQRVSTNEE